jgi:hypothetical protein
MSEIFNQTKNIAMAGTYYKSRLKRIKKKITKIITGQIYHKDVGASLVTMVLSPNKKWKKLKIAHCLT